jgi:cation/acetate symporter
VQIDIPNHDPTTNPAWFALKNPALVSMPLSFAAGIIVSLLRPERAAADKFAEVEHRVHFGAA